MGRFNLLDEPWISVMTDDKGTVKDVSLIELFKNAQNYRDLGGDTKPQDFAILRFLLAVLHTVFSRVDASGNPYEYLDLDERFFPNAPIDEDDADDYMDDLFDTWEELWDSGQFPAVVVDYLESWRDRFNLFDEDYPFYQINQSMMEEEKSNLLKKKDGTGRCYGKDINRLITESRNKKALFNPRTEQTKEILSESEIVRWLIAYQGYTGTGGKQTFRKKGADETWSKGWEYDLGGIYLEGYTLFETLMFNLALIHPEEEYVTNLERPCWEYKPEELLDYYLNRLHVDNLAELYTNWSRGVYIDSTQDLTKGFECIPIKLPEVIHQNQFLELMTLWRFNLTDKNKGTFTPAKHQFNRSLWRSFGLITLPTNRSAGSEQKQPGIMKWLEDVQSMTGEQRVRVSSVSMEDDGKGASWIPTNEIYDQLNINDYIITDDTESGWVFRIYQVVEDIKEVIERIYGGFLRDIAEIRYGKRKNEMIEEDKMAAYFEIDAPFRRWLRDIQPNDPKDETVRKWYDSLQKIIQAEARYLMNELTTKDYRGIVKNDRVFNVPMAYNSFNKKLNQKLGGRR